MCQIQYFHSVRTRAFTRVDKTSESSMKFLPVSTVALDPSSASDNPLNLGLARMHIATPRAYNARATKLISNNLLACPGAGAGAVVPRLHREPNSTLV